MPGMGAPAVPVGLANRARSDSDQAGGGAAAAMDSKPQLGGLFAGGMPKLKKRGGGVDTGGLFRRFWAVNHDIISNVSCSYGRSVIQNGSGSI